MPQAKRMVSCRRDWRAGYAALRGRLPLYGQELSPTITPLEAGLGFFVKLDKGDFIGREALVQSRRKRPAAQARRHRDDRPRHSAHALSRVRGRATDR